MSIASQLLLAGDRVPVLVTEHVATQELLEIFDDRQEDANAEDLRARLRNIKNVKSLEKTLSGEDEDDERRVVVKYLHGQGSDVACQFGEEGSGCRIESKASDGVDLGGGLKLVSLLLYNKFYVHALKALGSYHKLQVGVRIHYTGITTDYRRPHNNFPHFYISGLIFWLLFCLFCYTLHTNL